MAVPHSPDPYLGYNFFVEWDGIIYAGFQECSGLDTTQDAKEYREGTDPPTVRKIPGLVSYSNISLKRGITNNDELWRWRKKIMDGIVERRNVSIVLLDQQGSEKIRWNLTHCWPTTWSAPEMSAMTDDIAIESLEFVHEGVTVDKWS
ncbi:phage tail protein [Mastigocoleus testarum]|uniref:Phage tail protein n=1 Tax=Mastigocoleus testarum BC008 TaxID=371196 RepID=A0A0V7ZVK0_9CYAN|nr:phage tail protein [Mastigocoleus testarum]KST68640.1 phage tail protein [Mastigocoleus testarum BC008]